jgi:hypothetical protein
MAVLGAKEVLLSRDSQVSQPFRFAEKAEARFAAFVLLEINFWTSSAQIGLARHGHRSDSKGTFANGSRYNTELQPTPLKSSLVSRPPLLRPKPFIAPVDIKRSLVVKVIYTQSYHPLNP